MPLHEEFNELNKKITKFCFYKTIKHGELGMFSQDMYRYFSDTNLKEKSTL